MFSFTNLRPMLSLETLQQKKDAAITQLPFHNKVITESTSPISYKHFK